MEKKLQKKIVLISGASRGLGCEIAKILSTQGAHIIGLARTTGALEELSDQITESGGKSTMAPVDILVDKDLEKLAKAKENLKLLVLKNDEENLF